MNKTAIFAIWAAVCLLSVSGKSAASDDEQPEKDRPEQFAGTMTIGIRVLAGGYVVPISGVHLVRWSVEGLYQELKEPIPEDVARRLKELDKPSSKEMRKLLQDVRTQIGVRNGLEGDKDCEICFQAIFKHLEPIAQTKDRSTYIREGKAAKLNGPPVQRPQGIGLKVTSDSATGMLRVVTPILDGPAYKAGIRAGDIITQIRLTSDKNAHPLPEPQVLSTKGMSPTQAEELFLGQPGTRVTISVIPAGRAKKEK